MKAPKSGEPAQTFTLRHTAGKNVRFKGWKLADVSNWNPNAKDPVTGFLSGSQRWKERAVYQTEAGAIVCHRLGCSRVDGEVDRGDVLVIASPEQKATEGDPRIRPFLDRDGKPVGQPRPVEQQVIDFFGNDPLAKDLLEQLGIDDVEDIA
jgi:hypothetical protein